MTTINVGSRHCPLKIRGKWAIYCAEGVVNMWRLDSSQLNPKWGKLERADYEITYLY